MTKNLLLFLMIITAISCSKDDEPTPVIEVSNFELEITYITTNSVKASFDYKIIDLTSSVAKKVFYKEFNATEWQEGYAGEITGLKPGVKYRAKAVLSIENLKEESPEVIFTTLGFIHSSLIGDRILLNRQFDIFNSASGGNFNKAAPLKGYLKVENDSMELKDIEIIFDHTIRINFPENVQEFFKNDEEYIEIKPFTIGLFSGEYYTEITESYIWSDDPLVKDFNIYNKIPRIKSVTQEQFICDESTTMFYKIRLKGNFWTYENGFFDNSQTTYANAKIISLSISNINNPAIFKTFSKEEDMAYNENYSVDYCEKDIYRSLEVIVYNPFHLLQNINLHLSSENFPKGDYKIKFDVIDYSDEEYKSNEYLITLD